jgi:hypothetical protein
VEVVLDYLGSFGEVGLDQCQGLLDGEKGLIEVGGGMIFLLEVLLFDAEELSLYPCL